VLQSQCICSTTSHIVDSDLAGSVDNGTASLTPGATNRIVSVAEILPSSADRARLSIRTLKENAAVAIACTALTVTM